MGNIDLARKIIKGSQVSEQHDNPGILETCLQLANHQSLKSRFGFLYAKSPWHLRSGYKGVALAPDDLKWDQKNRQFFCIFKTCIIK
jgi:hypothetical protein